MGRNIFMRIVGIVFLFGAIYIAGYAIYACWQQLDATEWRVSMAVVTDISERKGSRGFGKHRNNVTVYDIGYLYNVNSDSYTGKIIGTMSYKAVGETFDVKYHPKAPENSTDILEPRPDALVLNIVQ